MEPFLAVRDLGVSPAWVFGSVARGEARADSDVDVLVELDQDRPLGIFEYAGLKIYIHEILDGAGDVANRGNDQATTPRQHSAGCRPCLLREWLPVMEPFLAAGSLAP
jgi:predicted nucleotidyltransferase